MSIIIKQQHKINVIQEEINSLIISFLFSIYDYCDKFAPPI